MATKREKSFVCVKDGKWSVRTPKPGMRDELKTRLIANGYTIKKEVFPPSLATMEKWSDDGIARTLMGERIEPDGTGKDGCPSWFLHYGVI